MTTYNYLRGRQYGLSLIELLIALAIGLLLLAGLTLIFVNSSQASKELQKSAQQIENGRYATDVLTQDIHHAGYYGHLHKLPAPPASLPDPCEIADKAKLKEALAYPVQGYQAATLTARPVITSTTCSSGLGLLTDANLKPGSDILVIRRADTYPLTGSTVSNEWYIQSKNTDAIIEKGNGGAVAAFNYKTADGVLSPIRKFHTHIYFVAPCSVGKGANGLCGGSNEDTIPTLKRLELSVVGGNTAMKIVPLVEGVEYLKVEYGIDDDPDTVSGATGVAGDSFVDRYVGSPSDAEWLSVIAAKIHILARNTEPTGDFTDSKTYALGPLTITPTDLNNISPALLRYKRHVFASAVRIVNAAGRREIP